MRICKICQEKLLKKERKMLAVQETTAVWYKSDKGGEAAQARNSFIFAASIEHKPLFTDQCVYGYRCFYQKGVKLYTSEEYDELMGFIKAKILPKRTYEPPVKLSQLKVKNLTFTQTEKGIEISFSYDPQINGKPVRSGHNKDFNNTESRFYRKDILNETAFVLKEGQKGRIMYNGRFTDIDTGQWWYEQTAVNIANIPFEAFHKDIFLEGEFDLTYSILAFLK